jgi:acyl dehydratase
MAHGLLTATLPTKIGGDMNFIARELTFRFYRPVFAGDTIECAVTLVRVEPADGFTNVTSEWICRNQNGKEVMTGRADGIVRT